MKKAAKSRTKEYGPMKLSKPQIFEIINEFTRLGEHKITADDYVYESAEEFEKKCKELSDLDIVLYMKLSFLKLTRSNSYIHIRDTNDIDMSAVLRIEGILEAAQRRPLFMYNDRLVVFLLAITSMVSIGVAWMRVQNLYLYIILIVSVIVMLIWLSYVKYMRNYKMSSFEMTNIELPATKVNASIAILVAIISAIVGGVVTPIMSKYIDSFWGVVQKPSVDTGASKQPAGN